MTFINSMNNILQKLINILDIKYDRKFDEPIFILAPPRSGSTMLFEALCKFKQLRHVDYESDFIWWKCFPYEDMIHPCDYINGELVNRENIELLRNSTYNALLTKYAGENYSWQKEPIRYLDKTIANCFHLNFLEKAFPTAQYIFLVRDPRENISSMLEGWPYVDRFGKAQLTPIVKSINGATVSHWTYPAPPFWQDVVTRPLPEICAWSWQQHIEHVVEFFKHRNKKPILIRYENLLKEPLTIFTDLSKRLKLNMTLTEKDYVTNPALSSTTVSKPEADKWKRKYYKEIMSILPMIEDTASKIDYDVTFEKNVYQL